MTKRDFIKGLEDFIRHSPKVESNGSEVVLSALRRVFDECNNADDKYWRAYIGIDTLVKLDTSRHIIPTDETKFVIKMNVKADAE